MTAIVRFVVLANGYSSDHGVSFIFDTFFAPVTFAGHVTMAAGDDSDVIFTILSANFRWEKGPNAGKFQGTFATDGTGIRIFSDAQKNHPIALDGTSEFGAPVISPNGMTLRLPNKNSAKHDFYYTLGISIDQNSAFFKFDPMIRNTGPRTFLETITQFIAAAATAAWRLLGYPFYRKPLVELNDDRYK